MNILLITPYFPFPSDKSGGVHTINMILKNVKDCHIDIFYYGEDQINTDSSKFIHTIRNIYYEDLRQKSFFCRIKSILRGKTYTLSMYKKNSHVLREILKSENYDKIIYDQYSSMNFDKCDYDKSILFLHDSMPLLFERKKVLLKGIGRLYYFLQEQYAIREEKSFYDNFSKIVFVSSNDVQLEKKLHPQFSSKFELCNLGIDMAAVSSSPQLNIDHYSLVFTGVMDYEPNEDAMLFFLSNVFPKVIEFYPTLKLYIVGKNPTNKLKELASKYRNVIVTGRVDNVFSYIKSCMVYISPLRVGSGKKNKIIEAMACKIPIIASDISMEGFDDLEMKTVIHANTTEEWITAIKSLLSDNHKMEILKEKMKNVIDDKYDWNVIAKKLLEI